MRKTEPSQNSVLLHNQPSRLRRFQRIQQLVFIKCADAREHVQTEFPSKHRCQRECSVALLRQPHQPLIDDFLDALGYESSRYRQGWSGSIDLIQLARVLEMLNDFANEKRISRRLAGQRLHERPRWTPSRDGL